MKKWIQIGCIITLLLPYFYIPRVSGKTLGELKKELEQKQAEYQKNKEEKQLTQQQIDSTNANIEKTKKEIDATYKDIDTLQKEIDNLNKDIEQKNQEMKDIINFVQVSNGESAYMEYAFGAKDFTDFIYRMAISEQLTKYNETLIADYNDMIQQNQKKQKEIEAKRATLAQHQISLRKQLESLGREMENLNDTGVSIEEDLKYQQEIIQVYKNKGCKDNEDIRQCGTSILPPGTKMFRQVEAGTVTSGYGNRPGLLNGWHEGIDVWNAQYRIPVYAVATGMVVTVIRQNSCGGNMVIVQHNINNRRYTTVYAHLYDITVSKEQMVTKDTMVGHMGGGRDTEWYDKCTRGQHSHLTVATGWYGMDYKTFYEMNYVYSVDPASVINFPAVGRSFVNRYTQY